MKRVLFYGATILLLVGCSSAPTVADDPLPTTAQPSTASPNPPPTQDAPAGEGNDGAGVASESEDESTVGPDTGNAHDVDVDVDPVQLAECGLTEDDIAYMQRDWERVVDSVGREDHGEYTQAFLGRLDALEVQGQGCPADQALTDFITVTEQLDAAIGDGPDYELYREAASTGNAWLGELGITADRLAAG